MTTNSTTNSIGLITLNNPIFILLSNTLVKISVVLSISTESYFMLQYFYKELFSIFLDELDWV